MIKVETNVNGVAKVSGYDGEVVLFYCFWQTRLWPEWMDHAKLGDEKDTATKQHKEVIANVKEGRELLLDNTVETFQTAIKYATDKCKLLGIEVIAA